MRDALEMASRSRAGAGVGMYVGVDIRRARGCGGQGGEEPAG